MDQQKQQISTDNSSTDDDFLTLPDPFAARPKIPREEFDASIVTARVTGKASTCKSLSRSLVQKVVHNAEKSIFKEGKGEDKTELAVVNDTLLESDGDDVNSNDVTYVDDDGDKMRNDRDQSRDDFTTPKGIFIFKIFYFKPKCE